MEFPEDLNKKYCFFTEREQDIFQRRNNGETYVKIAKSYDRSAARIREIYIKCLRKIEAHKEKE